jgi:hypothetical protein
LVALLLLSLSVILVMVVAFFAPSIAEQYAKEAVVFDPTNLSIDSFSTTGVKARIRGRFRLDASRVKNEAVRNLGRAGTSIARKVETESFTLAVYLADYENSLLGAATIPKIEFDIRNGHFTDVDIIAEVVPGEADSIRQIANDWLEGTLERVRLRGIATVPLKSGIFPLGTQKISETLNFEGQSLYSPVFSGVGNIGAIWADNRW